MKPGWAQESMRRRWVWVDRGRDYAARRVDCHGFVIGAALEFFGAAVPDPAYGSALVTLRHESAVAFGRALCVRVPRERAREGDLVLIQRADRWHTALYGGNGRVLQMTQGGVSFPSLDRTPLGRRVEGFYRVV